MLPYPFSREIAQGRDPDATRQPPIYCGLYECRCEKGKCDSPVDLSDTALLAIGDLLNVLHCSGDQLIEPLSGCCDRGDELGAGLGSDRTRVLTRRCWGGGNDFPRLV